MPVEDSLKQRVVGALILLALGVIFVPLLFETDSRRTLDRTSQVPPAPDIQPMTVAEPTRNPEVRPMKPAETMYQLLPESETEAATEPAPVAPATTVVSSPAPTADLVVKQAEPDRKLLDQQGIANAWMVQVSSFGSEQNAHALRDELLKDGFTAFTRTFDSGSGKVTRVFVGPKISREKASELKETLDTKLNVKTLVVSFSP